MAAARSTTICSLILYATFGVELLNKLLSEKWHSIAILVLYHLLEAIHIQLKVMPEGAAVGEFDLIPAVLLLIRVIHNQQAHIRIQ